MKVDASALKLLNSTRTAYGTDSLGRITSLSLHAQADLVLAALQPLDDLEKLQVFFPNDLSIEGMKVLARAKRIKSVELSRCRSKLLPPGAFAFLASLPLLQKVSIVYAGEGDEVLRHIAAATQLREVCLWDNFTDEGLQYIPHFQFLESLGLNGTKVTDAGMRYVSQLKTLKKLDLEGLPIGDEGLREIGKLRELRSLSLNSPRITDKGVESLRGSKHLRLLGLERAKCPTLAWNGSVLFNALSRYSWTALKLRTLVPGTCLAIRVLNWFRLSTLTYHRMEHGCF